MQASKTMTHMCVCFSLTLL